MMTIISVIVPVYKVESYLPRCIDSILSQTYTDFELILVDDGSPDNCGKICDEYAKRDHRIHVIHQNNCGVSVARNNGVIHATGDYVTFIDADDWISDTYLEGLLSACVNHNAQIAICDYSVAKSITENELKRITSDSGIIFSNREAIQFYAEKALTNESILFRSPWAKLIKRDIALHHLFPTDRKYAEDAACVYLWLWDADTIVHTNNALYFYFQNPNGICHQKMDSNVVGNFQTENEWISFFSINGFDSLYKKTCNRYFKDCVWALNGLKNSSKKDKAILKRIIRLGKQKYARPANIHINDYPQLYEFAYPARMKLYWYCQAIKRKCERK